MTPKPVKISDKDKAALKEMMVSSPFRTLLAVASSKADMALVDFANDSLLDTGENKRAISAKTKLEDAKRYQSFVEVAKEIVTTVNSGGEVCLVEISPTKV